MKMKRIHLLAFSVLISSLNILLQNNTTKANDIVDVVNVQPENPDVVNEIQNLGVLRGRSSNQISAYRLMVNSCKNVNSDGTVTKPKSDSSDVCQKLYRAHVNALRRAPFCKNEMFSLPKEISQDDSRQLVLLLKKRCNAAFNE